MADAMTKAEENCDARLKKEARIFSQMDAEAKQEKKDIEAYMKKYEDKKDIIIELKTKLGLKKVEGLYGDIAVVSDSRYRMGVVTLEGEVVVPFERYGWIGSFREDGTAPVRDGKRSSSKKDAKWGIINKHGEEVVPLHYKKNNQNNDKNMNERDCFSIEECFDYEGNFDYERLEDAIMDGEYIMEDW